MRSKSPEFNIPGFSCFFDIFLTFFDLTPQVDDYLICDENVALATEMSEVGFLLSCGRRKSKIANFENSPGVGRDHVACGSSKAPLGGHHYYQALRSLVGRSTQLLGPVSPRMHASPETL